MLECGKQIYIFFEKEGGAPPLHRQMHAAILLLYLNIYVLQKITLWVTQGRYMYQPSENYGDQAAPHQ
jgi:hypothetical protein